MAKIDVDIEMEKCISYNLNKIEKEKSKNKTDGKIHLIHYIGDVCIVSKNTGKTKTKLPFDMVVGSKNMVKVALKFMGLYEKYNTLDYNFLYHYSQEKEIPFILDYGVKSVGYRLDKHSITI